jgi:hypothetical protein
MDTSSYVFIGLAAASGVGAVAWYWIRRVQMNLDTNSQAVTSRAKQEDLDHLKERITSLEVNAEKSRADTVQAINGRAKQEDLDAIRTDVSDFKVECAKNFVSNAALMQVMTSLDRTIQQLTNAITHNSQESREGMAGLNKRIDDLMQRKP